MYDAIECLKGLSQIITAYDISVQDALKAGEMIGALNTIINDLYKQIAKEQQSQDF